MNGCGPLGVIGKLRLEDEYVRCRSSTPAFAALETWITNNMAAGRRVPDWAARYRSGATHAFVFGTESAPTFLAGAVAPSADRAGREFPIFAAREVDVTPTILRLTETLPLVVEELWTESSRVVAAAVQAGSERGLIELLGPLSVAPAVDLPDAISSYEEWTRTVPLSELTALLLGTTDPDSLTRTLGTVVGALRPHRGAAASRTRLCLRLPLGQSGGAGVCFWLAVARRVLAWKTSVPSLFWTHDGTSGELLLPVGTPPNSILTQLWAPFVSDEVLDATTLPVSVRAAPGVTLQVTSMADGTIADLLSVL